MTASAELRQHLASAGGGAHQLMADVDMAASILRTVERCPRRVNEAIAEVNVWAKIDRERKARDEARMALRGEGE